jgi:hypothetical protein
MLPHFINTVLDFIGRMDDNHENVSQNNRSTDRKSKPRPPENEAICNNYTTNFDSNTCTLHSIESFVRQMYESVSKIFRTEPITK